MLEDRMPPIPEDEMTPEQRAAAAAIAAGPRGAVVGPFVPLLRSPDLADRLQRLGEYLRFRSALPPRLTELVVLRVARRFGQRVEWAIHEPIARQRGVGVETIASLAEGRRPEGLPEDDAAALDLLEELWVDGRVRDATYAAAVRRLGERGVVDLVALAGYYALLSDVMSVARTPVPEGSPEPLVPLPR